jgi:ribonuclease BN (tRNA processing enzyme)
MIRASFRSLIIAITCLISTAVAADCGPGLRLQVLGSGGPEATGRRAGSGYLVWIDGQARVLVDAGSGISLRFGASGARFEDLALVAITHSHTDHVAELPSLLKSGYFTDRTRPLVLAGPEAGNDFPPLEGFLSSLLGPGQGAFRYLSGYLDGSDDLVRLERRTLDHRSRTPLPVYGADGLQVTALGVTHGSVPALAYRVEYGGRSLVFSGDQNGDDAQFVDFARGADLLVMAHAVPEDTGPVAARLHALPSEIGTIAQGAGVKHLVLSHLMRRSEQTLDQSLGIIRSHYPGSITVAEDMLCLDP